MQRRHMWWTSLLFVTGVVPCAVAQVPAGAASAAAAAAPGVVAAAPAPTTLWSFLGCSWEQKEECRRMLCKLPIGQLLNNATAPLGVMTGGIIPGFCPQTPSAEQLKDQDAVGAASAIKADEAAAKERRAAVRYLGTVDCHYWPEAQDALIASLRGDRNECVRFEAALALGNGCCCTKKTIEALINATICSNRDDYPRETSARVQAAARQALDHCLCCFQDMNPTPVEEIKNNPEKSKNNKNEATPEKSGDKNQKSSTTEPRKLGEATAQQRPTKMLYYARINEQPIELIVREGRRVLSITQPMPVTGSNSFAKLIDRASGVPETKGYIVHGGQPGQAELVVAKPTNLWDLMTGSNKPVVVSSYPARSVVVNEPTPSRVVPQPNTTSVAQATIAPKSTAMAASTINGSSIQASALPSVPVVQPPPLMPELKSATVPVVSLPPTPSPRPSEPVKTAVVPSAKVFEAKTAPAFQPIQSSTPTPVSTAPALPAVTAPAKGVPPVAKVVEAKTAPAIHSVQSSKTTPAAKASPAPAATAPAAKMPPAVTVVEAKPAPVIQPVQSSVPATVVIKPATPVVTRPVAPVATAASPAPVKPTVSPTQNVMQKISMGNVQERFTALESLSALHKASPELSAQLIKTAEQDSSEQVRCAAIRAIVRTGVPASQAIPVLAQLGMELESKIGKEANQALAQINLQLTGESK